MPQRETPDVPNDPDAPGASNGHPAPDVPAVGGPAPDFTLACDAGASVTLSALRGAPVVLFFYPRDDSASCTAEACEFRDRLPLFEEAGVTVLGVSPDTVASHARFKRKYALPYTLLADHDHAVAEAYGVWQQKTMYGRQFMGVERTTFLIDRDGRVAAVFTKLKAAGHAEAVAGALAGLG